MPIAIPARQTSTRGSSVKADLTKRDSLSQTCRWRAFQLSEAKVGAVEAFWQLYLNLKISLRTHRIIQPHVAERRKIETSLKTATGCLGGFTKLKTKIKSSTHSSPSGPSRDSWVMVPFCQAADQGQTMTNPSRDNYASLQRTAEAQPRRTLCSRQHIGRQRHGLVRLVHSWPEDFPVLLWE